MFRTRKTMIFVKRSEKGQDLAEYALLVGLIAITVILAITLIGGDLRDIFFQIASGFSF